MNVDQCQWPTKMMGRGVDGGCGAEERPCRPFRRATLEKENGNNGSEDMGSPEIDFLAQASKNLSERSPFDVPEDGSTSGVSVPTLPIVLANLLNQSDNKKRHKKSHSGTEKKKKKSSRQGDKLRSGGIWVEHEDYFRRLELPDLETLSDLASLRSLSSRNCFSVPSVEYESNNIQQRETDASTKNEDVVCADGVVLEEIKNLLRNEISEGTVIKEVVNEDVGQPMGVDNLGDAISSGSDYSGSLEWVLGCRNRILLTSERPSKKRKLLGGDAGLGKIMVAAPCEGNAVLCDFCCTGDAKEYHHQLIVCTSCKATVHKKCYGVLEDTDKSWLCSWCELENGPDDSEKPCLLCPKKGGILKPVLSKTENGGPVDFAHLFCSMWMPEVYIEDLKKMEPISNLPGIKETRRKLLCNLCKVKSGVCIRCCNGTCRTSFHPICAREAGNRLEVWGKHGCDTVELRAFCLKHSDIQESGKSVEGGESNAADSRSPICHLPSESVREGHLSNDEMGVDVGTPGTGSDISRNSELRELESPHSKFNRSATDNVESGMTGRSNEDERTLSKSLSFGLILKKLIDLGKVDVKDVAAEIGVNPDALSAKLADGVLLPDLLGKVVKWLSQHAHMGTWNKGENLKRKNTSKSEHRAAICTEGIVMLDSDILDPAVTKAFSLERTLESNICNDTTNNTICTLTENCTGNGIVVDEAKANKPVLKKEGSVSLAPEHSPEEQKSIVLDQEVHPRKSSVHPSDDHGEQSNSSSFGVMLENTFSLGPNSSQNRGNLNCPSPIILDLLDHEAYPGFNTHPYIHKELSELGKGQTLKSSTDSDVARMTTKPDGSEEGNKHLQSDHTICRNHQSQSADCGDACRQLSKARKLGLLDLSPDDEVEGELLYYQLQLLSTAVSRQQLSDNLVYEVAKKLPLEIDEQHGRRWDDVLVNKYFHDVREARKQGRKEKRHKQAQAVLAAATAAAATSSRNTSLRKDMSEAPAQQEMSTSRQKVAGSSHLVPQTKETLLKMAVSGPPSEKRSDHRTPDFSVENPRTCDICRRSETIWNLIVVCSSCKVAVHMDCYKCAKESTGPWYCELCAESSSEPSFNFWEKLYSSTECTLCGGTTGAFRKATNGQWLHAFCAEWSLESTFRRAQMNPVQGMESLAKNMDTCCVCQRIYGACIKCSYGNCQTTFHPSCARSAGFHLTGGGKLPHKAYCEKHSLEQKAKAESQKHGAEELKSLKHYRVELERLRLLCERIVKREKLKRELAISSHEILAAKRDHAARSLHVRNPFSPPEVSSDSATTSIKGHPDISGSEAIQRSDDITIDSTVTVKRRGKGPILMDTDQKTDDSATSKSRFSRKPTERQIFSGKTVPRKHCIVSPSVSEDGDKGSKPKKQHVETFAKELVMTSDEASFKNRRLPKGYFYVPVDCLQEDKPGNQKAASSDKPANQKTSSGDRSGKGG